MTYKEVLIQGLEEVQKCLIELSNGKASIEIANTIEYIKNN